MEDYAWVIEYMPSGHAAALRKEPAVQLMGTAFFTLLEATVLPNATIVVGQKVYVGKEGRQEISHIKGRIKYEDLTSGAREFLPAMIKKAVSEKESDLVAFINNAKPISIRVHTLDLLPGIGKKNMEALLKEREAKPFESFADIHKRVPTLAEPSTVFVHRILSELQGTEKYYLFTKPPFTAYPYGGQHSHMGPR
jgi:putative nucleotide binding protein